MPGSTVEWGALEGGVQVLTPQSAVYGPAAAAPWEHDRNADLQAPARPAGPEPAL